MGNYNIDNLKEDFADEDADIRVTLTLEDDSEEECRILTIFDMDGNDYIALLPLDENGDDKARSTFTAMRKTRRARLLYPTSRTRTNTTPSLTVSTSF